MKIITIFNSCALFFLLPSGFAQTPATPHQLETITVTATRTGETNLQQTPIAITTFDGEQLDQQGVQHIGDLVRQTPGVSLGQNVAYGQLYIRGVGTNNVFPGSDASSTVHYDGVYMARPLSVFSDFNNVERVEILKGPQGTLYGRNSAGGTINVISRLPSEEFYAKGKLEYGRFNQQHLAMSVSGPLQDDILMAGVSFFSHRRDGYLDNVDPAGSAKLNDEDRQGLAAKVRWRGSDSVEIIFSADVVERDENGPNAKAILQAVDGTPILGPQRINDPFQVRIPLHPKVKTRHQGGYIKTLVDLPEEIKLTSISAYREVDFSVLLDTDFTEADGVVTIIDEQQNQISQEIQLNGSTESFDWLTGFFFLTERDNFIGNIELPGVADNLGVASFRSLLDTKVETTAYALFFQGQYSYDEALAFTLGGRYSYEKKKVKGTGVLNLGGNIVPDYRTHQSESWTAFTPKLGVDYHFNEALFGYATISRGFKSGGFNGTRADNDAFDPEHLWAYEVGLKMNLWQQKLRVNSSLFFYDYKALQIQQFEIATNSAARAVISNAADATIRGLEVELVATPWSSLRFELAFSYLDARYDDFISVRTNELDTPVDVSGNRLNASPEYSVNASSYYFQDMEQGTLTYRLNYYWQAEEFYTQFNDKTTSQPAYGLVNASIGYSTLDESLQVILYGDNLANKDYVNATYDFSPFGVTKNIQAPRSYGIRLIYQWQ